MSLLKKISLFICLTIAFSYGKPGSTHAVVTESSLQIGKVAPEKATKITLYFNSHIELALSQIFLVSEGDVHHKLNAYSGPEPGQVIIDLPALAEGEYAILYKIFAADGHLTEDTIHCFVTR